MYEKSIPDFIQTLLENSKGFMKVKDLPAHMSFDTRRKLGLVRQKKPSAIAIKKAIELKIKDRFIFSKNGGTLYILVPRDPSDFVTASLSRDNPVSPKMLQRSLPFSRSDFRSILNELAESGRITTIYDDNLVPKIILSDVNAVISAKSEYTRERFKEAFDELEHGRVFVNIPELRKKLAWPHDVFDDMLRKLRDEEVIVLHVTDRTKDFEPEEFFYENDNSRMGMVTWNEGQQIDS